MLQQPKQEPLMITFYVSRRNGEDTIIEKIDQLAAQWRRSRSYVIMEALRRLIQVQEQVQEGDQCERD